MKILILSILSFLMVFMAAPAEMPVQPADNEAKIISVRMYADWCGNCKVLDEKVDKLKTSFDGEPVLFLQLDQTDDFRTKQASMLASKLSLDRVWNTYKGRTGMMLLVNADTGELLEEISHTWDSDKIRDTIKRHLKGS
jgi:thiol-disulfide isomerase/thioredoxin